MISIQWGHIAAGVVYEAPYVGHRNTVTHKVSDGHRYNGKWDASQILYTG